MSDNVCTGPDLATYQQWIAERKAALPPVRSEPLLAPCPFCGNVPTLVFRSTGLSDLSRPIISCPGPCAMKEVTTGPYMMADECIAAWNGRANAALTGGEAVPSNGVVGAQP